MSLYKQVAYHPVLWWNIDGELTKWVLSSWDQIKDGRYILVVEEGEHIGSSGFYIEGETETYNRMPYVSVINTKGLLTIDEALNAVKSLPEHAELCVRFNRGPGVRPGKKHIQAILDRLIKENFDLSQPLMQLYQYNL